MKTLGLLLLLQISCIGVEGFSQLVKLSAGKYKGPLQPRTNVKRNRVPKYVRKLYEENIKQGRSVNNLHCVFPKIQRTRRAIKLIFKNNSLKDQESSKWKRDELRIFMSTAKKAITSSNKPYFVKIFDLFSRRLVKIFKFSSNDNGWKTINITDWRLVKPGEDKRGRFGLKIVVLIAKKKLAINNTAFRESRAKHEPYFLEFFHEQDEKIETTKSKGTGLFPSQRYVRYNSLPISKNDISRRGYYLPFQRYDVGNN